MTETLTAARQEFALPTELVLLATGTAADKPRIYFVDPSATATLEKARARVREIEARQERELAQEFTKRVKSLAFVKAVWATWEPTLDVTVTVSKRDLEKELHLYTIFREVAAQLSDDPTLGDLAVLPASFEQEDAELLYSA